MSWHDWQHDIERQFNPRAWETDADTQHERRRALSEAARGRLRGEYDIRYGRRPRQLLDIYRAGDGTAPIVVYVHGGYWRTGEKENQSVLAEPLARAGFSTVMLGYDLCPAVTLDQLLSEILEGIEWVHANAARVGGDGARIYLYGHSAGGHLAAMALAHDWSARGLPEDVLAGAAMVSGIYELEPVLGITVNELIRLKPGMVDRLSPMRHPPRRPVPVVLAAGGRESPAFIEQTTDFAAVCERAGCPVELIIVAEDAHLTMIPSQADPAHPVNRAVVKALHALAARVPAAERD